MEVNKGDCFERYIIIDFPLMERFLSGNVRGFV